MFLKYYCASAEEYIGAYFVAFFKEFFCVFEFEVVVVFVCLRAETNFFYFYFHLLLLHFLCLFLLLVKELGVVNDTTNRWLRIWTYLYEIYTLLARDV